MERSSSHEALTRSRARITRATQRTLLVSTLGSLPPVAVPPPALSVREGPRATPALQPAAA